MKQFTNSYFCIMKTNSLNKIFINFFSDNNIDLDTNKFLLAVSGGIDSMVMLDLFKKNNLFFSVCTCDFSLRGNESLGDCLLVEKVCKKNNIIFYSKKFNTKKYVQKNNISIQMAARELRYNWFNKIMKKNNYDFLSTAHHNDDNFETILFNFIKTTGYKGLSGIPYKKNFIIRPLLKSGKNLLVDYSKKNGLFWRKDSSNDDIIYLRNNLRKKIIPLLKEINPSLEKSVIETANRLSKAQAFIKNEVKSYKNKYLLERENIIILNKGEWIKSENLDILIYDILEEYGFNFFQIELILSACRNNKIKEFISNKFILYTERDSLNIKPINLKYHYYGKFNSLEDIKINDLTIKVKKYSINKFLLNNSLKNAQIDYSKVLFPITIRNYRKGETFVPLGMNKNKKISNFLSDNKIAKIDRMKQCVIKDSNENIVWVVGHQIHNSYRITRKTSIVMDLQII
ncbi:MAG TPA: tRNA lysidine(34) synthetase TilS [Cytophagales bacterium]|nr:tRNA lysidine(34) synthetase TilS [Cytophagales bacterium]